MSLFIAVISLSVGYASLSSSLLVSGEAHLRVKEEVRVTNLTISEQISSSYDNNSEYYKNGLILRAVLPNKDSKVTYEVELTNNSSVDYYLKSAGYKSIEEDFYTEIDKNTMTFVKGDFKYTIEGIKTDDTVIKPNKSTFTITISYKDGLVEVPSNNNAVIDIRYEFDILDKIPPVVSFSPNGGCYGGTQLVRVTGYDEHFNHMDIEVYKNGEKIETKTVTYPNNSYDISLDEYTEYTIYVKAYDDTGNVQTIGPQDERGYTYQKYLIEEDNGYLYDKVKKCAVSDEDVDFSKKPTNEEAKQAYYIDTKTIYYYRGPVENNNVIFGGYCWKIVRTTETGGIKLLYSGKPTSDGKCTATGEEQFAFKSQFNPSSSNKKYVGYMYGDDDNPYENKYPSTIKENLEAWFEGNTTSNMTKPTGIDSLEFNNLTQYEESFLEDAVWCNDRTEGRVYGTIQYYAAYDRNVYKPYSTSLACPSNDSFTVSNENGNGKSKHKVGLITVDELTMGGMNWNTGRSGNLINTYLYIGVSNAYWWSLSPYTWGDGNAFVFRVNDILHNSYVTTSHGVRPMVSLQNSVEIETSGNGTTDNPYVVITDGTTSGKKLYDTMISAATEIVSDENVDFSQQPTNEDATKLYEYTGEITQYGYPIYYYRGPVTNNNVIFGGYCWKIVRTTETGGVKLIYSGKPTSDGKCTATGEEQFAFKSAFNPNANNKKYVGYMYGNASGSYLNENPSTIKKNIEAWFEGKSTNATGDPNGSVNPDYTDLTKYEESFLEDTVWCNDRTEGRVYGTIQYYAGYDRLYSPSLECPSNDSFTKLIENGNGELEHKVGMITIDELTMGGFYVTASNNSMNTYLYTGDRNARWWTLSPFKYDNGLANIFYVYDITYSAGVGASLGVRPMVSLVHDTKVIGSGTSEEPYEIIDPQTLYGKMLNAATETVSDINVDFGKQPTDDDATKLYKYTGETTQTGYPIYYYRGPVTNNNVIFAGYCWKIVRTTETGGIKLIYSGKPTNGQCLATGNSQTAFNSVFNISSDNKKYVGYMYGEDDKYENVEDSTIKKNLEAWFEGKRTNGYGDPDGSLNPAYIDLTKYEENYLEDAVWCNDRTERISGSHIFYAGSDRNTHTPPSPTLACPSNDSFTVSSANGNGKSTHKVGMITADELTMGGMLWETINDNNANTYLYTGGRWGWWTFSPINLVDGNLREFFVSEFTSNMTNTNVDSYISVRPMVSLKHGTMVSGGTGIASDPYVISEQ